MKDKETIPKEDMDKPDLIEICLAVCATCIMMTGCILAIIMVLHVICII